MLGNCLKLYLNKISQFLARVNVELEAKIYLQVIYLWVSFQKARAMLEKIQRMKWEQQCLIELATVASWLLFNERILTIQWKKWGKQLLPSPLLHHSELLREHSNFPELLCGTFVNVGSTHAVLRSTLLSELYP